MFRTYQSAWTPPIYLELECGNQAIPTRIDVKYLEWCPHIAQWYDSMKATIFRRIDWVPRGDLDGIPPEDMMCMEEQIRNMARSDGIPYGWYLTDEAAMATYNDGSTWQEWSIGTTDGTTNTAWNSWTTYGSDSSSSNNLIEVTAYGDTHRTYISANNTYRSITSDNTVEYPWMVWNGEVNETQEQRAERLQREAEAERARAESSARQAEQIRKMEAEKKEARKRADELLRGELNEEQLATYEKKGEFIVEVGTSRKRKFVIEKGRSGNIKELDENGHEIASFCVHPSIDCPDEDTMMAQKLMIESDLDAFLRIANRTGYREPVPHQ